MLRGQVQRIFILHIYKHFHCRTNKAHVTERDEETNHHNPGASHISLTSVLNSHPLSFTVRTNSKCGAIPSIITSLKGFQLEFDYHATEFLNHFWLLLQLVKKVSLWVWQCTAVSEPLMTSISCTSYVDTLHSFLNRCLVLCVKIHGADNSLLYKKITLADLEQNALTGSGL